MVTREGLEAETIRAVKFVGLIASWRSLRIDRTGGTPRTDMAVTFGEGNAPESATAAMGELARASQMDGQSEVFDYIVVANSEAPADIPRDATWTERGFVRTFHEWAVDVVQDASEFHRSVSRLDLDCWAARQVAANAEESARHTIEGWAQQAAGVAVLDRLQGELRIAVKMLLQTTTEPVASKPAPSLADHAPSPLVAVDIERLTLTVEDKAFPLANETVARFLSVLVDRQGEFASGTELARWDKALAGVNVTRTKGEFPEVVLPAINSVRSKGTRLDVETLVKHARNVN